MGNNWPKKGENGFQKDDRGVKAPTGASRVHRVGLPIPTVGDSVADAIQAYDQREQRVDRLSVPVQPSTAVSTINAEPVLPLAATVSDAPSGWELAREALNRGEQERAAVQETSALTAEPTAWELNRAELARGMEEHKRAAADFEPAAWQLARAEYARGVKERERAAADAAPDTRDVEQIAWDLARERFAAGGADQLIQRLSRSGRRQQKANARRGFWGQLFRR